MMPKSRSFARAPRHLLVAGAAAMAVALSPVPAMAKGPETPEAKARRSPLVIAHRGGAMNRPENTMPAFRHAVDLGVEIVEFDMVMTADDRIAVYHDGTINPNFCTPDAGSNVVAGPVRGLSLAQTRQFDCGTNVRSAYAGESYVAVPGARIPSLDEALAGLAGSKARLFIETKVPKPAPGVADIDLVKFAALVNDAVRRHGLEDRVILQSFDFRTIDALHRINPRIPTCLLGAPKLTQDYLALLRQHHASCIVLSDTEIDRDGVRALQDAGILVFSGVSDAPEGWQKYVDLGVDAIFANDAEGLINFLGRAGVRPQTRRLP